jgi:hypothetical protein
MTTDILVLNAAAASLVAGLWALAVPGLLFGAFLLGRWAAWRWFRENGAALADRLTAEENTRLAARLAEREVEVERLGAEVARRDERLRELVAVIRGAQLTSAHQTDILFTAINGRHSDE